ncbi:hypothetical protein GCM10010324_06320 [Streptomyces hiroshimensis]|uniref:Uncharacterized protein n=1 Tax=Streptomyces hiroshimensis TaxID=66424 RepID=A0ABQ2Y4F4_9ACTN|nr:hypothetical protein GCM10010324_06320 [Streptomyces hiroshimensis]
MPAPAEEKCPVGMAGPPGWEGAPARADEKCRRRGGSPAAGRGFAGFGKREVTAAAAEAPAEAAGTATYTIRNGRQVRP